MAKSFKQLKDKMPPESQARIDKRVQEMMIEMPLAELRHAREMTQKQLAEELEIKQASVSKMESQTDMYVSTMRKYIEAMGGELEIVAKFPDGKVKVDNFKALEVS